MLFFMMNVLLRFLVKFVLIKLPNQLIVMLIAFLWQNIVYMYLYKNRNQESVLHKIKTREAGSLVK